jgi:hypothetical protein
MCGTSIASNAYGTFGEQLHEPARVRGKCHRRNGFSARDQINDEREMIMDSSLWIAHYVDGAEA